MSEKLRGKIREYVQILQNYVDRFWYPPLIGFLAALDNIILVIPNDGILISSAMLTPKKWFVLALSVAIGSTVGALALAALVELQGLPWILSLYPGVSESKIWTFSMEFFEKYGLFLIFVVAIAPIMQQPAVIIASLAKTPLIALASVIFIGRFIKFLLMAYLGSHAPRVLGKLWGFKADLKDVGIQIDEKK